MDFYSDNPLYGIWWLFLEIVICGIIPAAILITDKGRKTPVALVSALVLAVLGLCVNRWVMVLQVMAAPVLTFEAWAMYYPSWQEVATTLLPVAYGIIFIALSYRYLPVFPQEQELNPIEPVESETETPAGENEEAVAASSAEALTPAEA